MTCRKSETGSSTPWTSHPFPAYFLAVGVPRTQKSVSSHTSPRWGYRQCRNQFPRGGGTANAEISFPRILPRGGGTANAEISSPHTTPRWGYREGRNQCITYFPRWGNREGRNQHTTYFPAVGVPRTQKLVHHILPRNVGTANAEISSPSSGNPELSKILPC